MKGMDPAERARTDALRLSRLTFLVPTSYDLGLGSDPLRVQRSSGQVARRIEDVCCVCLETLVGCKERNHKATRRRICCRSSPELRLQRVPRCFAACDEQPKGAHLRRP